MNLKISSPQDKEKVKKYIDKLPEGKKFDVVIRKRNEIRSVSQNKLYWMWLKCISDETGNDSEDMHDYFKDAFLPKEEHHVLGKIIEKPISTTVLDTAQFTSYLERIQQFALTTFGTVLPIPDDLHFNEFYDKYESYI